MMKEKFTIAEIKKYLIKCDSFGDAVYYLSAEKIREANKPEETEFDDDEFNDLYK